MATADPKELETELLQKIVDANDLAALEQLRIDTLGKKGIITLRMSQVGSIPVDQRKQCVEVRRHNGSR